MFIVKPRRHTKKRLAIWQASLGFNHFAVVTKIREIPSIRKIRDSEGIRYAPIIQAVALGGFLQYGFLPRAQYLVGA